MVIIFDFDGTMADSFTLIKELYNKHAPEYGVRTIESEEHWQEIRRMNFRQLMQSFEVKAFQIPKYLVVAKKLMLQEADKIQLFPGIVDVVNQLHQNGNELYVLSSNTEELVSKILSKNGISDKMTVMKSSRLFGKSQSVKRLIKQQKISTDSVMLVGDETRDIEAANKAGVKSIGVTWGFHPEDVLQLSNPSYFANNPQEIVEIIQGI